MFGVKTFGIQMFWVETFDIQMFGVKIFGIQSLEWRHSVFKRLDDNIRYSNVWSQEIRNSNVRSEVTLNCDSKYDSTVDHGYTRFLEWQEKESEENLEKGLQ